MSKDIADLLDSCLTDLQSGRHSLEECLAAHAAEAEELRPLLEMALAITPPPPIELDPAFRIRARSALIEAISAGGPVTKSPLKRFWEQLAVGRRRPLQRTPRRIPMTAVIVAIALVLTAALGGGGTYASQGALPGDALYPVKLTLEGLQTTLIVGDEAKAQANVRCADRRADEAEKAIESGRAAAAQMAAEGYIQCLAQAGQHLSQAAGAGKDVDDLAVRLSENLVRQQAKLAVVEERAPEPAKKALSRAGSEAEKGLTAALSVLEESAGRQSVAPTREITGTVPTGKRGQNEKNDREDEKGGPGPSVAISSTVALTFTQTISDVGSLKTDPEVAGRSYEGLLSKLEAAQAALQRGQNKAAINILDAFLNELNAMQRSGHISASNYDKLYAGYSLLVGQLGGTPGSQTPAKPEPTHRPEGSGRPDINPSGQPTSTVTSTPVATRTPTTEPEDAPGRSRGRPEDTPRVATPNANPTWVATPRPATPEPEDSGDRPKERRDDRSGQPTPNANPTRVATPRPPTPEPEDVPGRSDKRRDDPAGPSTGVPPKIAPPEATSTGPRSGRPDVERESDGDDSSQKETRSNRRDSRVPPEKSE